MRTVIVKVVTEVPELESITEDDWMSDRVDEIEAHLMELPGIAMSDVTKNDSGEYWT